MTIDNNKAVLVVGKKKRKIGVKTKPTARQRRWAVEYVRTMNGQEAARIAYAGSSPVTQKNMAYRNQNNPIVIGYMRDVLDEAGLTEKVMSEKLKTIIDASTSKRVLKKVRVDDGLRALDMTARMRGSYPAERKQIDKRVVTANYTQHDYSNKSMDEVVQELESLLAETKKFQKIVAESENRKQLKANGELPDENGVSEITAVEPKEKTNLDDYQVTDENGVKIAVPGVAVPPSFPEPRSRR